MLTCVKGNRGSSFNQRCVAGLLLQHKDRNADPAHAILVEIHQNGMFWPLHSMNDSMMLTVVFGADTCAMKLLTLRHSERP